MKEYISRQDAIDVVAKAYHYESDRLTALQELPTVAIAEESDNDRLKTILLNAIDIIFEHESGDTSRYDDVLKFWKYLFTELGTDSAELSSLGVDLSDYEPEGGFGNDGK